MLKTTFYVGLTDRLGYPLTRETAISHIVDTLAFYGIAGFSVTNQTGFWEGVEEMSLAVVVINEAGATFDTNEAAQILCRKLNQTAVFVTTETVAATMVYRAEGN